MNKVLAVYSNNSQAIFDPFAITIGELPGNGETSADTEAGILGDLLRQQEITVSSNWMQLSKLADIQCSQVQSKAQKIIVPKNQTALHLLREWMNDESGYDEKTWPIVKRTIEANRTSFRSRFNE